MYLVIRVLPSSYVVIGYDAMPPGSSECGPSVQRLPSLTGTDAARLDDYLPPLPSRQRVLEQVREALAEMEESPDPVLLLLVAEWGEGKTSIYNARIKPLLGSRGSWVLLEARAATLMAYLRELGRSSPEKDPSVRLLAALLAAGLESSGLLDKYGSPLHAGSLREYCTRVITSLVPRDGRLLVFIDELEDLVSGAREEEIAELVAGLLGIVNGDFELVSGKCNGDKCRPGGLHIVASLTPPAYSRLMGLRDFATVAARLKRRIRSVWLRPLSRRETLAFLESLSRYSLGSGLDALLLDHSLANAVASSTLGNMGALVSAFRYLVSWARGRGGCGDQVKRLSTGELLEALSGLVLSVGGTELPALNSEAYTRLREGLEARARLAGFPVERVIALFDELVARGAADSRVLEEASGLKPGLLEAVINEANLYAEEGWLRRELGVRRLVYRVGLVARVEDAFKLLRGVEPEVVKVLPQLASRDQSGDPLEQLLDSLVYSDPRGRQVVAVPLNEEEAVDLVADASPVELARAEAERLAGILWSNVFKPLLGSADERGFMLSPRVQRLVYVSPELSYLDFVSDRLERLQLVRKVYTVADHRHLLVGVVAALAGQGMIAQTPLPHGEAAARIWARLPGGGVARVLLVSVSGEVTESVAHRVEGLVTASLLSGWRPHAILVVGHGGVEPGASRILEALEGKFFLRVVVAGLQSLVSRVKLQALGLKLLESSAGLEEALEKASKIMADRIVAEDMGFDSLRLAQMLREIGEELRAKERLVRALEEGVEGAPLVVRDPRLGYEVERPTELSGALRYFLVVPSTHATAREALEAAYEYVLRYHLYRGAGGEARGLLSPDIERGEVGTLEKYMTLLVANGFLERANGSVRVDVLSPFEKSVLRALEQLNARTEEVPAEKLWGLLVVEARNPGTRRMLLQSLVYRGLVEASSRRIDPDKTRLRLHDTVEDARGLIRRLREKLGELKADETLAKWGLIVSAKARGIRGGSLEALFSKAEQLLRLAEEALRAGSPRTSLRLAYTVKELLDYVESELAPLVLEASRTASKIRRELEEQLQGIMEYSRAFTELVESLTGARVVIEAGEEELLRKALEVVDEVSEAKISEEELDKRLATLWSEAKKRNPRKPGEATPFYVNGQGPLVYFNYKLWLIVSKLQELGVAKLSENGVEASGKPSRALERLKRLLERLRSIAEETSESKRRAERLRERLEKLGAKPPSLAAIAFNMEVKDSHISLDEAEQLVSAMEASLEQARRPVVELEELISKVEQEAERLENLLREAEAWAKSLRELAGKAEEARLAHASRVGEAAEDLEAAIKQVLEHEERVKAKLSSSKADAWSLQGVLREARELLESAYIILKDSLEQAKRRHSELLEEADRQKHILLLEVEALTQALEATGIQPPKPPQTQDAVEAVEKLRGYLEKLQKLIEESGILQGLQLEAYKTIILERRRRGELLLREAIQLVAEKTGLPREEAKKIIISLIDKGVIEPKI